MASLKMSKSTSLIWNVALLKKNIGNYKMVTLLLFPLLFSGISNSEFDLKNKKKFTSFSYYVLCIFLMNIWLLWLSKLKLLNIVIFYQIFLSHAFTFPPAAAPIASTKLCAVGFLFVREKHSQTNTSSLWYLTPKGKGDAVWLCTT